MFLGSKKENGKDGKPPSPVKPAAPPAAAAAEPKPLPPDELKKRAEVSQRLAATVGEIVGLMVRSPRHRDHKISDLRWLVLPPIRSGQYALTSAQSKSHGYTAPIAAVLWARVSPEIDKRLEAKLDEPIRLAPREWKSGDIFWLIETIGDDRIVAAIVNRLQANEWKGRAVKARVADAKGEVKVRLIEAQPPANGAAARST